MSGARHEAYSVAVVKAHTQLIASAHDPELVLHLVGSHHGYGRALQPQVHDVGTRFSFEIDGQLVDYRGSAGLDAIEGGWADQFVLLNQRYGAWGLAFLETALRLADHQRSAWEVEHGDESI